MKPTVGVKSHRPMHQVQIDVVQSQILETRIQGLLHAGVIAAP